MKVKQKTPLFRSWLRCINKDTKEYIDIPFSRGLSERERKNSFRYAYMWNWSHVVGRNDTKEINFNKPKYHYYAIYLLDKNGELANNQTAVIPFMIPYTKKSLKKHLDSYKNLSKEFKQGSWNKKYDLPSSQVINGKPYLLVVLSVDLETNEIIVTDEISRYLKELNVDSIYDLINIQTLA